MFTHIFRYDETAVRIPPDGNRLGVKLQSGDWACIQCRALHSFCASFNEDHAGDCPGIIRPAPGNASLP